MGPRRDRGGTASGSCELHDDDGAGAQLARLPRGHLVEHRRRQQLRQQIDAGVSHLPEVYTS